MKKTATFLACLAALSLLTACGSSSFRPSSASEDPSASAQSTSRATSSFASAESSPVHVTGISLFETSLTMKVGDSRNLFYSVLPGNADNKNVSWKTDDTSVLEVTPKGRFTAKKVGQANVIVTTEDGGFTDSCLVTVVEEIHVASVSLNKDVITLEEGKTQKLYATVSPYEAKDRSVTWSSDDETVATVSSDGLVTAKKVGETTVTVKTNDGGFTATCAVTVVEGEKFSYSIGNTAGGLCDYRGGTTSADCIRLCTPITNDGNVNIYLDSCTYDIYTADDAPIQSISQYNVDVCPNILKPGETGYFSTTVSYQGDATSGLKAAVHPSVKNANGHKAVRYDLSDMEVTISTGLFQETIVTGKVTNNTVETASTLDKISVLLFDEDYRYLGTYADYLPVELKPGESCIFEASGLLTGGLNIDPAEVAHILSFACAFDMVF